MKCFCSSFAPFQKQLGLLILGILKLKLLLLYTTMFRICCKHYFLWVTLKFTSQAYILSFDAFGKQEMIAYLTG